MEWKSRQLMTMVILQVSNECGNALPDGIVDGLLNEDNVLVVDTTVLIEDDGGTIVDLMGPLVEGGAVVVVEGGTPVL